MIDYIMVDKMLAIKKWAVVGATNKKEKFGYKIFKTMLEAGYDVVPVNPGLETVGGMHCYKSVMDLPDNEYAVDLVVPADVGVKVLSECAEHGIKNIWLQPGADAEKVVNIANDLCMTYVKDACIMAEILKRK